MEKFKVAAIAKHPVQINLPFFHRLAQHPQIELTMFFGSDHGISSGKIPIVQRGITVKLYDVPDLSSFSFKFLKNIAPSRAAIGFWSPISPGIFSELRKGNFSAIIIPGYGVLFDLMAYIAAQLTNTPIMAMGETVLRDHRNGWKRILKDWFIRRWLSGVRVCLPIGKMSKEFYLHYGVPKENIFLVPYSVENEKFQSKAQELSVREDEIKKNYRIPPDKPVILFVGRLISRKHALDLLLAFECIQNQAVLVIVGDGPEKEMLEQHINMHQIINVLLTGYKKPEETWELYAIADIFAISSSFEPWGFVVNEALCFDLPVVAASGVCAAHDLVEHGKNGFVFLSRDTSALANHLSDLVKDSNLREAMGRYSRTIIDDWNYNVGVEQLVAAVKHIADHQYNCNSLSC